MYPQVKLKTSEEEKKTIETRLQVAQKDLATIRDREAKLSNEKVMFVQARIHTRLQRFMEISQIFGKNK